ncbi:MAG: ABC transporter permease subunit [Polyangiaceae bacterium]|nr:ABC transporter permease subunit [Polyangiaceae bacterium]
MSTETTLEKDEEKMPLHASAEESSDDREQDAEPSERKSSRRDASEDAGSTEKIILDRPSSAKMIWTVAKREIASYLQSPITYIVISVSLVVLGLWFFLYKGGFWQIDRASTTRLVESVPYGLMFLIPLFTMRALSDEKRVGTIELLITMPVKDSEVILGKYLGSFVMIVIGLALVCLYPIAMFTRAPFWHLGELDWNPFWVGMLGLCFFSAAGTAVGLMWSSFTESQILSFFATLITLAVLYFIGQVSIVELLRGWPGDAVSFLSMQTRFDPFARGIIDSRAIIYFLSLTVLCLMVAFRALESRKWT